MASLPRISSASSGVVEWATAAIRTFWWRTADWMIRSTPCTRVRTRSTGNTSPSRTERMGLILSIVPR